MANETYGNQVFLGELEVLGKLTARKSLVIGSDINATISIDNNGFKIKTPLSDLLCKDGKWSIGGNEILTTAVSITPESIGALSVAGGEIKGELSAVRLTSDSIKTTTANINKIQTVSINDAITINDNHVNIIALTVNGSKVYTTDNKPTPDEIGAISSTSPVVLNLTSKGQIDTGYLSITATINDQTVNQNGLYLYYGKNGSDIINHGPTNTGFRFFNIHDNKKTKVMELSSTGVLNACTVLENGERVYSLNNPPPVPTNFVDLNGATAMTGALTTPMVHTAVLSLGEINRIYSTNKPSCTTTNTDVTIRSSHGIGFFNPNSGCFVPKNENAFLFDVKSAIGTSRNSWVAPVINATTKYQLNGVTVIEKTNDGWLSINPNMDYENGLYFHDSILFTNNGLYVGDNGSAIKATADGILYAKNRINTTSVCLSPQPKTSWGIDNKSAITIEDNASAQWLIATTINDVIQTGIQSSKESIRLYTNAKKSFVEFLNGNVYISGTQDIENKNSLVSLGYFESITKNVPSIVDGLIKYQNSNGFIRLGLDDAIIGLPGNAITVSSSGPMYNTNKIHHTGNTNVLVWKGINQDGFPMHELPYGIYSLYYEHIENSEFDCSDVIVWDGSNKNGISGKKSYIMNSMLCWSSDFVLSEVRRFM